MEQKINALNVDIGVFLRKLRAHINSEDIYIGTMTAELLMCAVMCIDELVVKANIVEMQEKSIDFLNTLDERRFDIRSNIMCRLCIEPISVTQDDFENHIRKTNHIFHNRDAYTPPIQQIPETRSFELPSYSWPADQNRIIAEAGNSDNNNGSQTLFENIYFNSASEESKKRFQKTSEGVSRDDTRHEFPFYKERHEQNSQKNDSMENAIDVAWKGVRLLESSKSESDDSSRSSTHGFNFDSKFLIEVQGLPLSATRKDIANFFKDVHILNGPHGIHFLFDDEDRTSGHAMIQLEQLRDLQLVQTFHMNYMGDRRIKVVPANVKQFKDLVTKRQIPSKDRCVYLDGLPPMYSEPNIRLFFHDLMVERVNLIQKTTMSGVRAAYVKFSTIEDVEFAVKKHDKNITVYRASNEQMKNDDRTTGLSESLQLHSTHRLRAASMVSTKPIRKRN